MTVPTPASDTAADAVADASAPSVPVPAAASAASSVSVSPRRLAWRRFRANRLAAASAVFLVLVAIVAVFAPWIATHPPNAIDLSSSRLPPSGDHWFGTDPSGRDVYSRVVFGARVSLIVGLCAAFAAAGVGLLLGMIAGLVGGWVDAVLMRIADTVLSLPTLLVVLVLVAVTGPSIYTIILAIGLFEWPSTARIVRSVTLTARELDYVAAARNFGANVSHTVRRHILKVVISPLTVAGTVLVARGIMLEATLSFLGYGVAPPTATWGGMLNEAQNISVLQRMPWLWLAPGIAIALVVAAVNFLGDGLRDAQDPRGQR